jgi:hypothetical protein
VKRLNRALLSGAAGVAIFGATYGFAASLGLTSDSLGAATSVVAACQAGTINATYTLTYAAALPGYKVTTVTLNGLQAGCWSKAYKVTLSGAAGASLAEITGTTPGAGTIVTVAFAGVDVSAVTGISVVFSG